MSDNTANTGGIALTIFGWIWAFVGLMDASLVPIILSSVASLMAILNYYYQIKKNRK